VLFLNDPYDVWSFVYFIQAESGPIKIGITDNIEKRKNELQTANHEKLTVLHYTTGGRALEKHLHERFNKFNKLGEWFWPDDEIIKFIYELTIEDQYYGRIDSIVHFALNNGFEIDDRETLVDLSRGSILCSSQVEEKLYYWKILDSYKKYLENYPQKVVRKRRLSTRINEGYQPKDIEINNLIAGNS
jgi:hypothetical protein